MSEPSSPQSPAVKEEVARSPNPNAVLCPAKKYIYDLRSYEWKEVDCLIRVPNPNKAIGRGGMRVCYEVEDVDEDGLGTPMVAKLFRRNIADVVEKDYFNEGAAQCMCEEFANNFNRIHLDSIQKPNISFLQCYVVRIPRKNIPEAYQRTNNGFFSYKTQDSREVLFVMEPMLSGLFTKYNSNYGDTYREEKKTQLTSTAAERRMHIFEAAEAFSHFTLVESGGSMLLCDLQGVHDFLTDPQIHTEDGKGLGMGNMGQEGIDKWVAKHECNDVCRALGFQELHGQAPVSTIRDREKNPYVGLHAKLRSRNPVQLRDLVPLSKPLDQMSESERVDYVLKLSELTN